MEQVVRETNITEKSQIKISDGTLSMMDAAIKNLKDGKVSEVVDLSEFENSST